MPTLLLFILFALSLSVMTEYLRPYAPLLKLRPVVCGSCGARRWRMAT